MYREEFKKSFRNCRFGNSRNGNLQNDQLLIQNTNTNPKFSKKERGGGDPPKPPPPSPNDKPVKRAEHVLTTDEEHARLVSLRGEALVQRAYEHFSLWKIDTPRSKWKKNDYRSILRWVFKAIEEQDLKDKKLKIQDEICKNYQSKKNNPEKKEWNQKSEHSRETISEPDSKGPVLAKVESPLMEKPNKFCENGSSPDKISWWL
jgi:hypothetical protein